MGVVGGNKSSVSLWIYIKVVCSKVLLPPYTNSVPMIHATEFWETRDAPATAGLFHGYEVKHVLDARVQQRHAAHDARLVGRENGERGEEVVRAVAGFRRGGLLGIRAGG
jgi:hypothetical protein